MQRLYVCCAQLIYLISVGTADTLSNADPITQSPPDLETFIAKTRYYYVMYTYGEVRPPGGTTPWVDFHYDREPSSKDDKVWIIDTQTDEYVVIVKFASSPMTCTTDSVKVLDGSRSDSPLLGQWCDGAARTVKSTGEKIRIHFHTPAMTSQSGVYFKYKGDIAPRIYNSLDVTILVSGAIGFLICVAYLFLFMFCLYRRRKTDKDLITIPIISASDDEASVMISVRDDRVQAVVSSGHDLQDRGHIDNEPSQSNVNDDIQVKGKRGIKMSQPNVDDGHELQVTGRGDNSAKKTQRGDNRTDPHGQQRNISQVGIDNPAYFEETRGDNSAAIGGEAEWNPDIRDGKLFLRSTSINNDI